MEYNHTTEIISTERMWEIYYSQLASPDVLSQFINVFMDNFLCIPSRELLLMRRVCKQAKYRLDHNRQFFDYILYEFKTNLKILASQVIKKQQTTEVGPTLEKPDPWALHVNVVQAFKSELAYTFAGLEARMLILEKDKPKPLEEEDEEEELDEERESFDDCVDRLCRTTPPIECLADLPPVVWKYAARCIHISLLDNKYGFLEEDPRTSSPRAYNLLKEHLWSYLNDWDKCITWQPTEIFNKLLDKCLAMMTPKSISYKPIEVLADFCHDIRDCGYNRGIHNEVIPTQIESIVFRIEQKRITEPDPKVTSYIYVCVVDVKHIYMAESVSEIFNNFYGSFDDGRFYPTPKFKPEVFDLLILLDKDWVPVIKSHFICQNLGFNNVTKKVPVRNVNWEEYDKKAARSAYVREENERKRRV